MYLLRNVTTLFSKHLVLSVFVCVSLCVSALDDFYQTILQPCPCSGQAPNGVPKIYGDMRSETQVDSLANNFFINDWLTAINS